MKKRKQGKARAKALEKIRRHVRILVELGRLTAEDLTLEQFLDKAVVLVARAVEIDHVKVLRYRRKTADLFVVAGIGWKEGVVRAATLSADIRTAPGRAFQTAQPVTISDWAEQDEFLLSPFLREHGIVSLTNVPLLTDSAAWGVLEVDSTVPRDFGEDTTDFLTAAGALMGGFIERLSGRPAETAKLAAAAAEAESRNVLLRELQHRVKNNFQLVLASIAVRRRRYSGSEAQQALDYVAERINAISLAHDQLSLGQAGQIVRLPDYVRALCASLRQQTERVDIDVEADEIELAIDRAVPLGLILNELATNSIKHAFGPEGGGIRVRLAGGIGYGEASLAVTDNGRGMADPSVGGAGLQLIQSLAKQIGGSVEQESSKHGTTTTVRFPLIA